MFVSTRKILSNNSLVFSRINNIELKQLTYDKKFDKIFDYMSLNEQKQGLFYNGEVFDAYLFVCDSIKSAKKEIILIDNYIDDTVFTLFSKKDQNIKVKIYTKTLSKQLELSLNKFNEQYGLMKIIKFNKSHDRFLIIDKENIYHIGASLKDLGKKWFAFSKLDKDILNLQYLY